MKLKKVYPIREAIVFDGIPDTGIQLESEKGGWDKRLRVSNPSKGLNSTEKALE